MNRDTRVDSLFSDLDNRSRALLWRLLWVRHAHISDLRDLIGAADDYQVLYHLNEIINRKAEAVLGGPVVEFALSRIDPATGNRIESHWWLRLEEEDGWGPPLLDLYEERDRVVIVAEIPGGVDHSRAEIRWRNGFLEISLPRVSARGSQP